MWSAVRDRLVVGLSLLLVLTAKPTHGQNYQGQPYVPGAIAQSAPYAQEPNPVSYHTTTYAAAPGLQPGVQPGVQSGVDGNLYQPAAPGVVGLLDNFMLFAGLNGSKSPEDLGINAGFGTRVGLNWGIPILQEAGLGIQIGFAENFHNNAVRVLKTVDGTTQNFQTWVTLGLFQRAESGLNWGVAYDFRFDDYYRSLSTGQWRAQVGVSFSDTDEIGAWGTVRMEEDRIRLDDFELTVRPVNQLAFFWRHVWGNHATTRVWGGFADSHGRFVLVNPGTSATHTPFLFGADVYVPLNEWLALWGEANFITPNDTGTVTAFFGVAITPGTAQVFGRSRFAPYLPTANNTSFPLDVR